MNWRNILSRLRTGKNPSPIVNNFDYKLVQKIHQHFLPNFSQLKYLTRFLNPTEKKILKVSILILTLVAGLWGGVTIARHSTFTAKNGGEYSEGMIGQPKLINPIFSSTADIDSDLSYLVFSGLFRYNQNLQLVPDLASDYTVSKDQKTYTITLRQDIKWSDGEPFTANDVLYTLETIQNPDVGSPLFPAFQGVNIEKIANDKIRFTLKEPYTPFLNILTTGIIPEHIWGEISPSAIKLAKNNLQPIGTGPWKFEKLSKDDVGTIQSYTFSKNTNYYDKIPFLDTITIKLFSDYQEAIDALRSKDISAISFVPRQYRDKLPKKIKTYGLELPQYTALFFNQNNLNLLKDDDLRLALATSLDKNAILSSSLNGEGVITESPFLKNSLGYFPEIKAPNYDTTAANALLDKNWKKIAPEEYFELKYDEYIKNRQNEITAITNATSSLTTATETIAQIKKETAESVRQEMDSDQTFYRKDKNDKILSVEITTNDTGEYGSAALSIAKMWRTIGIHTTIKQIPTRQLSRDILKPRDYQILLYGEIVGGDPDPFPFWHSSQAEFPGLNLAMYANRTADKLLEDARLETDSGKRADLYKKFQNILNKEIPAIFLYSPIYTFAVNKNIQGINIKNIINPSDRYSDLGNWYIKTSWRWKP